MATIYNTIIVATDETTTNIQRDLYAETGLRELAALKLVDFMKKTCSGAHPSAVQTKIGGVKATGTVTLSAFANADTFTINGVVFTGKTAAPGANEFLLGADDTSAAAAAVIVINANTTLDGMVIATSALGVITLTALVPGELGNAVTLAISAHGSVSGSGRMTGGTNGDQETTHYFGSGS